MKDLFYFRYPESGILCLLKFANHLLYYHSRITSKLTYSYKHLQIESSSPSWPVFLGLLLCACVEVGEGGGGDFIVSMCDVSNNYFLCPKFVFLLFFFPNVTPLEFIGYEFCFVFSCQCCSHHCTCVWCLSTAGLTATRSLLPSSSGRLTDVSTQPCHDARCRRSGSGLCNTEDLEGHSTESQVQSLPLSSASPVIMAAWETGSEQQLESDRDVYSHLSFEIILNIYFLSFAVATIKKFLHFVRFKRQTISLCHRSPVCPCFET